MERMEKGERKGGSGKEIESEVLCGWGVGFVLVINDDKRHRGDFFFQYIRDVQNKNSHMVGDNEHKSA